MRGRAAWARAWRGAAVVVAAALLQVGAMALAILRLGLWNDFVFWTLTFNRFYYLDAQLPGSSALRTLGESVGEAPCCGPGASGVSGGPHGLHGEGRQHPKSPSLPR